MQALFCVIGTANAMDTAAPAAVTAPAAGPVARAVAGSLAAIAIAAMQQYVTARTFFVAVWVQVIYGIHSRRPGKLLPLQCVPQRVG